MNLSLKKLLSALYIAVCILMCAVLSAGMLFGSDDEMIGNERSTALPDICDGNGNFNIDYFTQLSSYFEKHFALRKQVITADAQIQSKLFGVSNIDTVITGTQGWLYYSSSLNDYLGKNTLSDKEISGVVHNLQIIKSYVESRGADFLFTIAPNKNTLYPSHMPYYYSSRVSNVHNRDLLNTALSESDINYVNLFDVFENEHEVLYFERDSHWNNKGALIAYNEITDSLGKTHDDYSSAQVSRRKDFSGDLSKMLYPASSDKEYNYYYGAEERYSYLTDTKSVEDTFIVTECPSASGRLYMYRDSFGNALLPFFASAYETATFTKSFPMILETDIEKSTPDTVIMELVERNINWLVTMPPVLPAPRLLYFKTSSQLCENVDITAKICDYSPMYIEIRADLSYDYYTQGDYVAYIAITDKQNNVVAYECYDCVDNSVLAYVPSDSCDFSDEGLNMAVVLSDGNEFVELGSSIVNLGGSNDEQ